MADIYLEVEDYLWFQEYQQGNVNVAGLVFDDLIEETFDAGHDVYVVWTDIIEDTFDISPAFTPYHFPLVSESLVIKELFGIPLRVKQSILNIAMSSPMTPIQVAHLHIDILHGPDTFWEEVSSELQIHSSYVQAVPYYWEWIYESIAIDMTEPQPLPPIYLRLYLLVNDLVNMRHDVTQEYYFNSKCFEEFFIWDSVVWGWDHKVAESLVSTDTMQEIIGKVADDYLYLGDAEALLLKVLHIIDDRVFIFDAGTHEKYYLLTAADTIDFGDVLQEIFGHLVYEALSFEGVPVSGLIRYCSAEDAVHTEDDSVSERYYLCLADEIVEMTDDSVTFLSLNRSVAETFNASATTVMMGTFVALASESLIFTDIDSYIHGLIIEEGLAFGDVELTKWVVNVLIESGCNVSDIIA